MDGGVELGHPVARDEERGQVEQVHKHLVAVAAGRARGDEGQGTSPRSRQGGIRCRTRRSPRV